MQPRTGITGDKPLMGAMQGIARSIREVQLLLLLVTALFYFVARAAIVSPALWFVSLLAFGLIVLGGSLLPGLRSPPRRLLVFEIITMVVFITVLSALAGTSAGPLSHLYLLPVVTAALLLGRGATVALLLLVLACRLFAGVVVAGVDAWPFAMLITLFAEMLPALLIAFLTCALASDLHQATGTIKSLAERDDLTGLYNLRSFSQLADAACHPAARGGDPCALLMLDVDHLGQINDRFGHEAGDRALRAVADCIRRATRETDLCARYGGDEFVILLPRCGRFAAEAVANRIRHDVYAGSQDFDYAMRRLAVTTGMATAPDDGHELSSLFRKAVRNLRKEKQARKARSADVGPASGQPAP